MLGSLTFYRKFLNDTLFNPSSAKSALLSSTNSSESGRLNASSPPKLPTLGHGLAGIMAGATVSFIAAPIEHVKARLQVQYAADKSKRLYTGPIDCCRKIVGLVFSFERSPRPRLTYRQSRRHGMRGLYHGLGATLIFRGFFFFWWSSYDIFTQYFSHHTSLSTPAVNFWAGGLSAQIFWLTSYPSDVVKQRIMTDPLGPERRFPRWRDAAKTIYRENGLKGYWRGFLPCFLRAFPANAMALVAFEGVMRALP